MAVKPSRQGTIDSLSALMKTSTILPHDYTVTPPRVSVIMPTYNQGAFLPRAIASLRAQTFQQWELLIIDDGSTDNTPGLVESLASDPRIRAWRLPENQGLGYALNRGLGAARSPLISYLPSDDLYFENHLNDLKSCLDQDLKASLAFAGVRFHR